MAEKKKTTKKTTITKKLAEKKTKSYVQQVDINDPSFVHFQWVRTHNLKDIDVSIPKNKLSVITGVSWSGKSSFAFDTLYKEWQYRYIESLGSYLRQFFNLGERPDVDHCAGLSPAIAIEQNKKVGNSRSTVWTLTEIDDYLRLLFSKVWDLYCYKSGKQIKPQTIDQIIDAIYDEFLDKKIYMLKELGKIDSPEKLAKFARKNTKHVDEWKWFTRYLIQYEHNEAIESVEYFYLETPNIPQDHFPVTVYGVFDRVTVEDTKKERLKEDVIKILTEVKKFGIRLQEWTKDEDTTIKRFTDKNYSPDFDISYPEFTPQYFSPNRQEWACPTCHGVGEELQVDMDKIIDPNSSYLEAIIPWRDSAFGQWILVKLAQKYSINPQGKWWELPEWFLHVVIEWDEELLRIKTGEKFASIYYRGIQEVLKDQYNKGLLTVDFQAMLDMKPCHSCHGAKLRVESLHVFLTIPEKLLIKKEMLFLSRDELFVNKWAYNEDRSYTKPIDDGLVKYNIQDLQTIPLGELIQFLQLFQKHHSKASILVDRIINPLLDRIGTIEQLGLPYITLHRNVGTLSGWEIQRLRLAKQLGNKLTWITYVLDEPTIGLSDKEIVKTIASIRKLQKMGNTIVVVEHHDAFIKEADWIVEIGPGAGDFGWNLLFSGPYEQFIKGNTLTADYINGKKKIAVDFTHKPNPNKSVTIRKASKYNLHNVTASIALWSFTIITGPSGAGKTTLMYETLFKFMNDKQKFIQSYIRLELLKKWRSWQEIISAPVMNKNDYVHYENLALQDFYQEIAVDTIQGHDDIKNTVYVDQSSIGKTPRSCPATFIGVFDKIRTMFAGTSQAKYLGFNTSHFSFNSKKGACPACKWYGYKKVELQFLPDTYIHCEMCNGNRYKKEILDIQWHDKSIAQILNMYVDEALELFKEIDHIKEELQLMVDIGLGYLKMGQPAHTLSWWESQRLKLVKHLLKSYRWHTMYFLDEPTVGLHDADIENLLYVIKKFLDNGDTVLMIEHDQNLLKFADQVIELDDGKLVK